MTDPTETRAVLLLLGGGGHGAVVAEAARLSGWRLAGYLDDAAPADGRGPTGGVPQLGTIGDLTAVIGTLNQPVMLHAAVGDPVLRQRWLGAAAAPAPAIVHPTAAVSPDAHLAEGVFVGPLAVINAGAEVAMGVIINSAAVVEHDCRVGEFAHVAPRAVLTGSVTVGAAALIGAGAVVLPGRTIGPRAVVGAGSVVVRDVAEGHTVMGVPARKSDAATQRRSDEGSD